MVWARHCIVIHDLASSTFNAHASQWRIQGWLLGDVYWHLANCQQLVVYVRSFAVNPAWGSDGRFPRKILNFVRPKSALPTISKNNFSRLGSTPMVKMWDRKGLPYMNRHNICKCHFSFRLLAEMSTIAGISSLMSLCVNNSNNAFMLSKPMVLLPAVLTNLKPELVRSTEAGATGSSRKSLSRKYTSGKSFVSIRPGVVSIEFGNCKFIY